MQPNKFKQMIMKLRSCKSV